MENDSDSHTSTRARRGKTAHTPSTQRDDTPEVIGRRKARVNSDGLQTQRQHDKHTSQTDGGAFKTCWPFTRVDGKALEAAHAKERQRQVEEVGEALL